MPRISLDRAEFDFGGHVFMDRMHRAHDQVRGSREAVRHGAERAAAATAQVAKEMKDGFVRDVRAVLGSSKTKKVVSGAEQAVSAVSNLVGLMPSLKSPAAYGLVVGPVGWTAGAVQLGIQVVQLIMMDKRDVNSRPNPFLEGEAAAKDSPGTFETLRIKKAHDIMVSSVISTAGAIDLGTGLAFGNPVSSAAIISAVDSMATSIGSWSDVYHAKKARGSQVGGIYTPYYFEVMDSIFRDVGVVATGRAIHHMVNAAFSAIATAQVPFVGGVINTLGHISSGAIVQLLPKYIPALQVLAEVEFLAQRIHYVAHMEAQGGDEDLATGLYNHLVYSRPDCLVQYQSKLATRFEAAGHRTMAHMVRPHRIGMAVEPAGWLPLVRRLQP